MTHDIHPAADHDPRRPEPAPESDAPYSIVEPIGEGFGTICFVKQTRYRDAVARCIVTQP